eukprot:c18739_g5_i1 orf=85-573(-)
MVQGVTQSLARLPKVNQFNRRTCAIISGKGRSRHHVCFFKMREHIFWHRLELLGGRSRFLQVQYEVIFWSSGVHVLSCIWIRLWRNSTPRGFNKIVVWMPLVQPCLCKPNSCLLCMSFGIPQHDINLRLGCWYDTHLIKVEIGPGGNMILHYGADIKVPSFY